MTCEWFNVGLLVYNFNTVSTFPKGSQLPAVHSGLSTIIPCHKYSLPLSFQFVLNCLDSMEELRARARLESCRVCLHLCVCFRSASQVLILTSFVTFSSISRICSCSFHSHIFIPALFWCLPTGIQLHLWCWWVISCPLCSFSHLLTHSCALPVYSYLCMSAAHLRSSALIRTG